MTNFEFKIIKETEANGREKFFVYVNDELQKCKSSYDEAKAVLETCKRNTKTWNKDHLTEIVYLEKWEG